MLAWIKTVMVAILVFLPQMLVADTQKEVIDKLEKLLKRPVITSMQAFMWDMLRTSGENKQITGLGTLFRISNEIKDFERLKTLKDSRNQISFLDPF